MVHCDFHPFGILNRGTGFMTIEIGKPFDMQKFSGDKSQEIINALARRINAGSQIGLCNDGFCVRPMSQSPGSVRDVVAEVIRDVVSSHEPITSQLHALGKVCSGVCELCKCSYGAKVGSQT